MQGFHAGIILIVRLAFNVLERHNISLRVRAGVWVVGGAWETLPRSDGDGESFGMMEEKLRS